MKEIGQRYIWTAKLIPKDRPNCPCLKLRRIPAPDSSTSSSLASRFRRSPNPPPDAPSNFPPTSVSSPSSNSSHSSSPCCSSCCSCSCSSASSSPCSCSPSSSSPSLSRKLSTCSAPSSPLDHRYPAQETEDWTCEIVDGHRKVILRRRLYDSSMLRTCPSSAPQRRFRGSLEKTPL